MQLTAGQLTSLRSKNQKAAIYMSVLRPATLWAALINDITITKGETTIAFDGGVGGAFAQVGALQEVWVGTGAGLDDIGRLRVISIASGTGGVSGTLTVARNALDLADNQFLTFKHTYPPKPRYPLIEGPPETAVFNKDGDVTYSGQNEDTAPVCIAGENRANFIDSTLGYFEITSQLPNSYTTAAGATISAYAATVYPTTGVTVSINAGTGAGFIRFATAGIYWVRWSVTDSNGVTQVSYRWYYAHSTNPQSPHYPTINFNITQINGDWQRGGWETGINMHSAVDVATIPDKTGVIIWQVASYNGTTENVTFLPDESNTLISGYVRKEKIEHDIGPGVGDVDFSVVTINHVLQNHYMFSVSLAARSTPTQWYEYNPNLTVPQALHHFWRWHFTLFEIADVFLGDNVDGRAYAEIEDGNIYSMADDLARSKGIRAHVVCDKGNRVHLTYDIQLLTDAERAALTVVQAIDKLDRSGDLTLMREPYNRTAFVKTSGFAWDGTFSGSGCPEPPCPNVEALCSSAPGIMPSDEGANIVDFDRQIFRDQNHADQLAGRFFAQLNNRYPELRVNYHGNYLGVLDIAYPEFWTISLTATDSAREIVWTDQKLICRSVTAQVNVEQGTIVCAVAYEPEQPGFDGVAGYCLDQVPDHGGELPPVEPPAESEPEIVTGASVYRLEGTSWNFLTGEATNDVIKDPFWQTKQASTDPADVILIRCGAGYIKRSVNAGTTWATVTPGTDPPNDEGDAPAPTAGDLTYTMLTGNTNVSGEFFAIANYTNGSGDHRTWLLKTTDDFSTYSWSYVGLENCGIGIGDCDGIVGGVPLFLNKPGQNAYTLYSSNVTIVGYSFIGGGSKGSHLAAYDQTGTVVSSIDLTFGSLFSDMHIPPHLCRVSDDKLIVLYSPIGTSSTGVVLRTVEFSGGAISLGPTYNLFSTHEQTNPPPLDDITNYSLVCPNSSTLLVFMGNQVIGGTPCTTWDNFGLYVACATVGLTSIVFGTTTCSGNTIRDWQLVDNAYSGYSELKAVKRQNNQVAIAFLTTVASVESVGIIAGTFTSCFSSPTWGTPAIFDSWNAGDDVRALTFEMVDNDTTFTNVAAIITRIVLGGSGITHQVYLTKITFASDVTNVGSTQFLWADSGNYDVAITKLTTSLLAVSYVNDSDTNCSSGTVLIEYNGISFSVIKLCQHEAQGTLIGTARCSNTEYFKLSVYSSCFVSTGNLAGCAKPYNGKSLGITSDNSTYIYLTFWDQAQERLYLLKYTISGLDYEAGYYLDGFGPVTESELDANTYIAWPYADPVDNNRVFALGRMPNAEFTAALSHIVQTDDQGDTWALVEDSWGTAYASSLYISALGYLFAIQSTASSAKLYRDSFDFNLVLKSTLTFLEGVELHGMKVDSRNRVVIGANGPDAIMVVRVINPYDATKITNITYDHGTGAGINALEILE